VTFLRLVADWDTSPVWTLQTDYTMKFNGFGVIPNSGKTHKIKGRYGVS